MKVNGLQCPKCKDIIYSRAGHDFRYCTCGACFVDGGQSEYGSRWGYTPGDAPEPVQIEVIGLEDVKQLYQDWNFSRNKYGILKGGKVDLSHKILSVGDVRFDGSEQRSDSDDNRKASSDQLPAASRNKRTPRKKRTRAVDSAGSEG